MNRSNTGLDIGVGEKFTTVVSVTESFNGQVTPVALTENDIVKYGLIYNNQLYPRPEGVVGKNLDYSSSWTDGILTLEFDYDDTASIPVSGDKQNASILLWIKKADGSYSQVFLLTIQISETFIQEFN